MTLGPGKLCPTHRNILRRKSHRILRKKYNSGKIEWADKILSTLKNEIRTALRKQQGGRCYFCRRTVLVERKNAYESIEHYLDKSKPHYRKWAFSPVNLTISCHACNFQKSTADLGDNAIRASVALRSNAGSFKWLHPYFDDYHENIEVLPGWVYKAIGGAPKEAAAKALIVDCQLDKVETIEAHRHAASNYRVRLIELATRAINAGNKERAKKLLSYAKQIEEDSWKV